MQMVANARRSYEGANQGFATSNVGALVRALGYLTTHEESLNGAKNADFAGMMIEDGDEYHVYYFAISRGLQVAPVELNDLNTVDLGATLSQSFPADTLNPETYFLRIDGARGSGAYFYVSEELNGLK